MLSSQLARATHLVRAILGGHSGWRGALEMPRRGETVGASFDVSGWAFSYGAPVVRVEASLGQTWLGALSHAVPRPDVGAAFPGRAATASGYRGTVSVPPTDGGRSILVVRVTDARGRSVAFRQVLEIRQSTANRETERLTTMPSHTERVIAPAAIMNPPHPRQSSRPAFLVITDTIPTPDRDSGSFRMDQVLRLLTTLGYQVTVAAAAPAIDAGYVARLRAAGVSTISGDQAIEHELAENGRTYRFVMVSRPSTATRFMFAVRAAAPQATMVYDTVDLHWLRFEREAALGADANSLRESGRIKQEELCAAESADLALTVTDMEREVLLRELPTARVAVLPNIHPRLQGEPDCDGRSGLLFVGGFLHRPNVDAVQYFVAEVLPLVHQRCPDLRFFIVGSDMPENIRALRSSLVEPVGHVSDLSAHFATRRLFVAPLRYGAGMKGKVGQSLSAGLPVVTTTVGADGMELHNEEHAMIADSPAEFAGAIERVCTDDTLWRHLSVRGRAHVRTHFSDEAARARLERLFPLTEVVQ